MILSPRTGCHQDLRNCRMKDGYDWDDEISAISGCRYELASTYDVNETIKVMEQCLQTHQCNEISGDDFPSRNINCKTCLNSYLDKVQRDKMSDVSAQSIASFVGVQQQISLQFISRRGSEVKVVDIFNVIMALIVAIIQKSVTSSEFLIDGEALVLIGAEVIEAAGAISAIPGVAEIVIAGVIIYFAFHVGAAIIAIIFPPKKSDPDECTACSREVLLEGIFKNVSRAITVFSANTNCYCQEQPRTPRHGKSNDEDFDNLQEVCFGKRIGERCEICCEAGYHSRPSNVECRGDGCRPARWVPDATCDPVACTIRGQISFIPVRNCVGHLYYGVKYSTVRRLPSWVIYKFGLNNENHGIVRTGSFVAYPCPQLEGLQLTSDSYTEIGGNLYNKGHFAPNGDFNFFADSAKATFFYTNAAPQDDYTNQVPWRKLEGRIKKALEGSVGPSRDQRKGYVLTGICNDNIAHPSGVPIPTCFWKLVCTVTDAREPTTAAFYHSNTNVNWGNPGEKQRRKTEVLTIRDPAELGIQIGIDLNDLWNEAAREFPEVQIGIAEVEISQCGRGNHLGTPVRVNRFNATMEPLHDFWTRLIFGNSTNLANIVRSN